MKNSPRQIRADAFMSDYFDVTRCVPLNSVQKGSHVHVIGICGVAMAQIAIELMKAGYVVSGSDREFYEPMGGLLRSTSIKLYTGYDQSNISESVALVVIGNAISSTNPELEAIKQRNIPYTIFPQLLSDMVISDRRSIVVAGTHGKSTTSALGASVLSHAGYQPSYFVGGVVKGFSTGLAVGKGQTSIVEGDEYDSAFFAKVPKFYFYRADCLIITSIEFDHADIYDSLQQIETVFFEAAKRVPKNGIIVACADCPNIRRLLPIWEKSLDAQIITYGFEPEAVIQIVDRKFKDGTQTLRLAESGKTIECKGLPTLGMHNARNATAIYIAMRFAGLSDTQIEEGFHSFQGVKRRQDIRLNNDDITIIEDFAHHPTAVKETLLAIKEGYPGRRLICLFEPRSNTSRRKVFEEDYGNAFKDADLVLIKKVSARHNDEGIELMDIDRVADRINQGGVTALTMDQTTDIISYVCENKLPKDVVVVMSNGSFDGLIDSLIERLSKF